MRLAPVPLFFARRPEVAIRRAAESSRTTHGAPEAVDACRYLAGLIVGAVQGRSKKELLAPLFTPVAALWNREPLAPRIHEVAAGSFLCREPPQIRGPGYVVESLEAALWAFAKSTSFEHGALLAVNLGDDADTTGAVYGQLAGAYYGADAIPPGWRSKLAHLDTLENFAARLLVAASRSAGPFPFQNNESRMSCSCRSAVSNARSMSPLSSLKSIAPSSCIVPPSSTGARRRPVRRRRLIQEIWPARLCRCRNCCRANRNARKSRYGCSTGRQSIEPITASVSALAVLTASTEIDRSNVASTPPMCAASPSR
jgi:hypothetical protein